MKSIIALAVKSALKKIILAALSEVVIKKIVLGLLEEGARRTDWEMDDEIVADIKKALN